MSVGTEVVDNLSNMDFEYFQAEIDKFKYIKEDGVDFAGESGQNRDSAFFKDKVIDMERDLKKVVDICQAMLVFSKDKHFQNIEYEE